MLVKLLLMLLGLLGTLESFKLGLKRLHLGLSFFDSPIALLNILAILELVGQIG